MDVTEAIEHRLEVREYADEPVGEEVKHEVLEAARLAPSGKNRQHWRFVLVDDPDDLAELAARSTTGGWVEDAAFAVVVLTDPALSYHELDAGRAITHMQLAAWTAGVGSCIFTGFDEDAVRDLFDVPDGYAVSAVVGFGYPVGPGRGRKSRRPIEAVAFRDRFGKSVGS